ncbi:uncharacterized protein LOC144100255 [Amblyomma americanum]
MMGTPAPIQAQAQARQHSAPWMWMDAFVVILFMGVDAFFPAMNLPSTSCVLTQKQAGLRGHLLLVPTRNAGPNMRSLSRHRTGVTRIPERRMRASGSRRH